MQFWTLTHGCNVNKICPFNEIYWILSNIIVGWVTSWQFGLADLLCNYVAVAANFLLLANWSVIRVPVVFGVCMCVCMCVQLQAHLDSAQQAEQDLKMAIQTKCAQLEEEQKRWVMGAARCTLHSQDRSLYVCVRIRDL